MRFRRTIYAIVALGCILVTAAAVLGSSKDDTTHVVRPGIPGERPFWNINGKRFIYAPAFDMPTVAGAASYRFTIATHDGKYHNFTADKPTAALSPVWSDVAEGYTTLNVEGIDLAGNVVGASGEKVFYRSPGFSGAAAEAIKPYDIAGREALKAMFENNSVQAWLADGKPDPTYARYCYPNKVIGGVVRGMTAYSKLAESETDRDSALRIARVAAAYLLSVRYPADAKYANVAPTYLLNVDKPAGGKLTPERVEQRWIMVPSIVDSALGYLDLYDATNDAKLLDAAKAAADTLSKTQDIDGTWPLQADWKTGEPVAPHRMTPTWVISFLDRLDTQYKLTQYRDVRKRAWQYVVANPLKTYQWDAQFEDVKLKPPYMNLAREQACDVAVLLLSDDKPSVETIEQAEELIRFSEDQFVLWAEVTDVDGWRKAMPDRYQSADIWIAPGVFEQFVCYGPVARSGAIMINTYLKAYDVTHNAAYLEKAKAIANGMLAGQKHSAENYGTNGEIPTWNMRRPPTNWMNNSFYSAQSLLHVAEYVKQQSASK